jgi:signal transduction histidine kinase
LDLGLVTGLEWLCQEFSRQTMLPCRLHGANEDIHLNEAFSIVVFRIVQESLTNVARYAAASQVNITIRSSNHQLVLEIRDNGRGFDVAAVQQQKTFGLMGMRERATALGGRVDIESAPAQGTTVRVSIPMDNQATKETT